MAQILVRHLEWKVAGEGSVVRVSIRASQDIYCGHKCKFKHCYSIKLGKCTRQTWIFRERPDLSHVKLLNLIVITLEKGISQYLEAISDGSAVQNSMNRGCRTTNIPHVLHSSSKSCCWLTELLSAASTGCTSCL